MSLPLIKDFLTKLVWSLISIAPVEQEISFGNESVMLDAVADAAYTDDRQSYPYVFALQKQVQKKYPQNFEWSKFDC